MKKYISSPIRLISRFALAALLLAVALPALAQTGNDVVYDTTEVIVGGKVITIAVDTATGKKDVQVTRLQNDHDDPSGDEDKVKPVQVSALGIDIGANWLMHGGAFGTPAELSAFETEPLRSTNVALHCLPTHFNMAKGHVSILTAITFDNNRYQFRNNYTLQPRQDLVTMTADSLSFKKNKLNVWYAQIPLMLSFQTKPGHEKGNFHIALGGFAGLFIGASTKQKSEEMGKVILKDDFNLEPLRYGLTARIGYGNLELYSTYTLSPLFKESEGPSFNNINFGIALTGMM